MQRSEGIAVYAAVNAVSGELSHDGIGKSRQATGFASYKFRGIDEVMNALAPLLVKHKLIIVPRILERECVERQSSKGNVLFSVTVAAEFDFISAEDGSKVTARTYGEAMDSGDKATNKAMAIAYKYAAFQTFCIPTEGTGDTDADATVHEPIKPKEAPKPQASKPAENPIKSNAPNEAAASVPAASSPPIKPPSRADSVPTVVPTRKPASHNIADRLIAQLRLRNASISKHGLNIDTVIAGHEEWKLEAQTAWNELEGIDQRRVKAEREKIEAAIEAAQKARGAANPKAAISRGDLVCRETGEILSEAAE